GLLVQSRVGDVRDVSQRLERGEGPFLVPQIDRQKLNVSAAGQLGLAAWDSDHLPARGKKLLDRGNPQQAARTCDQHLVRNDLLLSGRVHDSTSPPQSALRPPSTTRSAPAT